MDESVCCAPLKAIIFSKFHPPLYPLTHILQCYERTSLHDLDINFVLKLSVRVYFDGIDHDVLR